MNPALASSLLHPAMGEPADEVALHEERDQVDRGDAGERGGCHLAEIHQPVTLEERDTDLAVFAWRRRR